MKIFLDCGANNGGSVLQFRGMYADWREYTTHCFEPNPSFRECFDKFDGVIFHQEAVWIEHEELPFYLDARGKGSSLLSFKKTGNLDKKAPVPVRCIDFSWWLSENFSLHDYIVLKMDIEGVEFDVLRRMIDEGTIRYVNELFVEFHYGKMGDMDVSPEAQKALVRDIRKGGLEPRLWRQPKPPKPKNKERRR